MTRSLLNNGDFTLETNYWLVDPLAEFVPGSGPSELGCMRPGSGRRNPAVIQHTNTPALHAPLRSEIRFSANRRPDIYPD